MVVHAMLAMAAAAAAPPNAAAPAENLLPVDAALARWDMAEARILARALPKGAERCAVEGIIATRDNRLDEVSESLPRCLAILEQTHSPRAHAAFEALLDTYFRQGAYRKEYALIVRWLAAHGEPVDPDELADLREALGTAAALCPGVALPQVPGNVQNQIPQQGLGTILTASGIAALLVPLIGGALGGLWGAKTGRNRP